MDTTSDTNVMPPPSPGPKRFERSSTDRIIGGVCGGLGRYFNIDPTIVRIAFVALALIGGVGFFVYAAALLLVPLDEEAPPAEQSTRDRAIAAGLIVALVLVAIAFGSFGLVGGFALVPLWLLLIVGVTVYSFAEGRRPGESPRHVLVRAVQGFGLMIACFALAVGSFFASGLGGGVVVAGLVIAAGAGLVAAAFVGGARWLVLPALAIALPLAFVSAAGIDLDGGFGQRNERPATMAELRDSYRIGMGELVLDLRELELPAGDHALSVDVGTGRALVLVPDNVCVASKATVGMGAVGIFDRDSGGIDVDWNDSRRPRKGAPRLIVNGKIGLGMLEVRHRDNGHRGPRWDDRNRNSGERNSACATST
jgi:phage shock protein PspC (stress-responsive transcriptional regulator)